MPAFTGAADRTRSPGPVIPVVDEPHQQMVADALLPGRCHVVLLSRDVRSPTRVQIHGYQTAASNAAAPVNFQTCSRTLARAVGIAAKAVARPRRELRRPNADRLADPDGPHLGEQRERHGSYRWVAVIAAGRRVRCR